MAIQPHSGTELERSNHFKKSRITSNLEHIVLANDDVIKKRKIFIQADLHHRTSKETYLETRL